MPTPRDIPHSNEISNFLHCALCIGELPTGMSLQGFARTEVGHTPLGAP